MQFFLDTANVNEIKELTATGLISGVTTNPSLAAATGMNFIDLIKTIAPMVDGPVSAEVVALDAKSMIEQGQKLAKIADNVVIKVPLTMDGLTACSELTADGIDVNVTLCFNLNQAILAGEASARFVSPFVGRLEDAGQDGCRLISDIAQYYAKSLCDTSVLAASIRTPEQVAQVALAGADAVTLPPSIFRQLFNHDLTQKGLDAFMSDWKKSGLKI